MFFLKSISCNRLVDRCNYQIFCTVVGMCVAIYCPNMKDRYNANIMQVNYIDKYMPTNIIHVELHISILILHVNLR